MKSLIPCAALRVRAGRQPLSLPASALFPILFRLFNRLKRLGSPPRTARGVVAARAAWVVAFQCAALVGLASSAQAQGSATYRLHREASSTASTLQLKTANPDAAALALSSVNLKNFAAGDYVVQGFDTQSGTPNAPGVILQGSTVTVKVWMKRSGTSGTIYPRVKLSLNSAGGASIFAATGASPLNTTLTAYTLTGTVPANVTMTTADRFYLWVGVNIATVATANSQGELDIEGTLNGNYDSWVTAPLPVPPPAVTGISPTSGASSTSVTVTGTNFGATQGTGIVTFNGTSATPTSWGNTSIVAPVPAGATTGPVVVQARGQNSNGVTFTVLLTGGLAGTVTRAADGSSLSGAAVDALQGGIVKSSATTAANGTYTMGGVVAGTYDLRVSAVGYLTKLQSGVVVNGSATTTFNQNLDAVAGGDVSYVYDEVGRLVSVIGPAESAGYVYDATGNLTSITRRNSNLPSVIGFTPGAGPAGASVTIYGTSFGTMPAQNAVAFNGVAATVTSTTATQIVTSVPAGATTGLVTVNTPTGLATSAAPFTVTGTSAPTITGFTPTVGAAGTTVTITGTNFDTTPANDSVAFNTTYAQTTTATATSISTSIPIVATSGRVYVTTPNGTATSAADFFVPPSPYVAADVLSTGRMALGESKTVALATANKIGLVLFDAAAGQRVSLKVTSSTVASCRVAIYSPNASTLASMTVNTSGGFLDTPLLPSTGSYTILVDPDSANTGSVTFTLYNASDATASITPGGAPVTVNTSTPGQNAQVTFDGTAGQRVSLKVSGIALTGGNGYLDVYIKHPDGSTLASSTFVSSSAFVETLTLPLTGQYVILVDPQGTNTGAATLTLYDVPSDVTGTIAPGGAPVTVTTTVAGQDAVLTFTGTADQRVSLKISGVSLTGGNGYLDAYIRRPDGTTLTSTTFISSSGGFIEPATLPVSGTYSILVSPQGTNVGSATLTLYDVPPDIVGPITPGGAAVTITTTTPGQNARPTFDATAGQRVSLKITGVSMTGGNGWVNVAILNAAGSTVTSTTVDSSGGFLDVSALAAAGTYTVFVDPWTTNVGSATLTLYDVPADVTGPIPADGTATTATTTAPGQAARLTFSATAGQRVSLKISGVTVSGNSWVNVAILNPSGSTVTSTTVDSNGGFLDVQTLAAAGTYTVLVDPWTTNTGSVMLNLYTVPADASAPITPGGSAVTLATSTPGQNAYATFTGALNQRVSLSISGVQLTGNSWVTVTIKKPDGSSLSSTTVDGNGGYLDAQTLPVAGTYTVFVDPWTTNTGSVTLTLYDIPGDASNSTTVGGSAVSVSTSTPGQNAKVTFPGTAGQQVTVHLTANTYGAVTVSLLRPDGTSMTSTISSGNSFNLAAQTLPTTGTYTISIDPSGANIGGISVSVTTP